MTVVASVVLLLRLRAFGQAQVAWKAEKEATRSWRKGFASRMMDAGVPIRVIQELLGHSSLSTTERYLAVTQRSMRAAVRTVE